jgi:death-on-curing protein
MSAEAVFLTVEDVQAIHRRMIEQFGGHAGLRDRGLLASAVAMPAARFEGVLLHGTLPEQAAAYLFHLCRNHPFLDGNKRTALVAAEVFLSLNGARLAATNRQVERLTRGVADGSVSKPQVTDFFQAHVRRPGR